MQIDIKRGQVFNLSDLQEYSICLDGASPGPQVDTEHHRFSFDHHQGCLRFNTLSACQQTRAAILLGLDDLDKYTVYANDVDADVCASIWCLNNPDRCKEPMVEKLINAIGLMDMYSGAINCNGMHKVVEWICAPEVESKKNLDYNKLSDDGLQSILEAVQHRITLYVDGESSEQVAKYSAELHTKQKRNPGYKILRNENGWAVIETKDSHIYYTLYQLGLERLLVCRKQTDKTIIFSIAKKSDFIDEFPLIKMYEELNKIEPGWGGSTAIGGSPRDGSKLTIDKVVEVIDECINSGRKE